MLGLSKIKNDIIRLQNEGCRLKGYFAEHDEKLSRICLSGDVQSQLQGLEKNCELQCASQDKVLSEFGDMLRKMDDRLKKTEALTKCLDHDMAEVQKRKKPGRKPKAK